MRTSYLLSKMLMLVILMFALAGAVVPVGALVASGDQALDEFVALDKTGTTGVQENEEGSQVLLFQDLASLGSFQAERTGVSEIAFLHPPPRRRSSTPRCVTY